MCEIVLLRPVSTLHQLIISRPASDNSQGSTLDLWIVLECTIHIPTVVLGKLEKECCGMNMCFFGGAGEVE